MYLVVVASMAPAPSTGIGSRDTKKSQGSDTGTGRGPGGVGRCNGEFPSRDTILLTPLVLRGHCIHDRFHID